MEAPAPQLGAQIETGSPREAYVENHDVVVPSERLVASFREARRQRGIDAMLPQSVAHQTRELGIIFYDQYSHRSTLSLERRKDYHAATAAPEE